MDGVRLEPQVFVRDRRSFEIRHFFDLPAAGNKAAWSVDYYLFFTDDRNIIFHVARNHAIIASGTSVQVDCHCPFFLLVLMNGYDAINFFMPFLDE